MQTVSPDAAACARRLREEIESWPPEQRLRAFDWAEELRREDGVYFGEREGEEAPAQFDLVPLVLDSAEWAGIEAGLRQRLRAWNLFLRDIYTGQQILQDGIVPYQIIYTDPNFQRGCARLPSATPSYLQLAAFDLQKTAQGRWIVCDNHLSVAPGAAYALRKRQVMRQIAPRLFDGVEIMPIDDFAVQLMDVLKQWVRQPGGSVRAVLLAGGGDGYYVDHASLARQMGVSIVQSSDLIVLDSKLYLKTIAGIDRVDVVLRRLPTSQLDPVTFDGRGGVPGLLSCVRKGELAMANGMGSDLADNLALAVHLPAIIDYYLGEKILLPSQPAYELRDLDMRGEVADRRDKYIIRHAWRHDEQWNLRDLPPGAWDELWRRIDLAPHEYVAQRLQPPAPAPAWTAHGPCELPVTLRAFSLGESRISPCVLAWTGPGPAPTPAQMQASDRIKDVWILRPTAAAPLSIFARADDAPARLRLTSRVAEAFFWMGRYAERAEATTRALRIVQLQPWPGPGPAGPRGPLWRAMAALSGHKPDFFFQENRPVADIPDLPFYFLLDRAHGKSVISSLLGWRQNAESIREHFPPEVWSVLNRLYLQVALGADQAAAPEVRRMLDDRSFHHEILTQLDELTGALEKHMLHDDAWHFWRLGVSAERSLTTLLALRQVVGPDFADAAGNLDLLLQMLAGQYAYRSLYHARPVAARVARLLLQDEVFPRSALFCLQRIRAALAATLGDNPGPGAARPLRHCHDLIAALQRLDIVACFPPSAGIPGGENFGSIPTPAFTAALGENIEAIRDFNGLISDHYLNHQVVISEPELLSA